MTAITAHATVRADALLEAIDLDRLRISRELDSARRVELGQFLTPAPVARQLAAMFGPVSRDVRILDPGAGIGSLGSLGASLVAHLLSRRQVLSGITLRAYELDEMLFSQLKRTSEALDELCASAGVAFEASQNPERLKQ
jgi:adenine-specific DNA-methyltransferase